MAVARRMGLLALIPLLSTRHDALVSQANTPAGKVVMEPFTGIEFEEQKQIDSKDYHLHATAVRCMLGQKLGQDLKRLNEPFSYRDANEALRAVQDGNGQGLCSWTIHGRQTTCKENILCRRGLVQRMRLMHKVNETAVLTRAMRRSLVLVMDKDVAGHHIAKGFDKSLLPRIRKAQAGLKRGAGKDALRDFTSCFNRQKILKKGSEVALLWTPDNKLVVYIENRVQAVIDSPILCRAVFDMYLGLDSIFRKYRNMSFTFHDNDTSET